MHIPLWPSPLCLAAVAALAPTAAAQCPTIHRVQNYTDGQLTLTGWCEEYAGEGEAALISTIPAADLPIQILRIGIGWRSTTPGGVVSEAAIRVIGSDPIGLSHNPPTLYMIPNPSFTDGLINEFDVSTASPAWIISTQPFTVWIESDGAWPGTFAHGAPAHDADGCTVDANRFRGITFPFLNMWYDSCYTYAVGGDVVLWLDYVSLNECPAGTPYCFGDGTGSACPCGNTGAIGRGCDNSFATGGGRLEAHGLASVTSDSLQLRASFLPPTSSALFFQGTSQIGGGAGAAFGDGLRCVGGTTVRLGTNFATGGLVDFGHGVAGDPPIGVAGAVPPGGGVRQYQVWYRNAPAFCTTATFNLTCAVEVPWVP
jgi:hypothetical protein